MLRFRICFFWKRLKFETKGGLILCKNPGGRNRTVYDSPRWSYFSVMRTPRTWESRRNQSASCKFLSNVLFACLDLGFWWCFFFIFCSGLQQHYVWFYHGTHVCSNLSTQCMFWFPTFVGMHDLGVSHKQYIYIYTWILNQILFLPNHMRMQ